MRFDTANKILKIYIFSEALRSIAFPPAIPLWVPIMQLQGKEQYMKVDCH